MVQVPDDGFELGGIVFGRSGELIVESFDPGTRGIRSQDVDASFSDATWFGRDMRSPATWAWELSTNARDQERAFALLESLEAVWDDDDLRLTPNAVVPLRYNISGRTRVVYGRPREFSAQIDIRRHSGYIPITASFKRVDTLHYADVESSATVDILPSTAGGLIVPFTVPFSTVRPEIPREGQIVVGGTTSTWARVRIVAPLGIVNPKVSVGGWQIGAVGAYGPGSVIELDARPWARSALLNGNGGGLRLTSATNLSTMKLAPGPHQIRFSGKDLSGTATVTVTWRDASKTL